MGTTVVKLIQQRSAESAEAVLHAFEDATIAPATSQRCMAPSCTNQCQWPTGPSRPSLFCGESCRKSYEYTRSQLLTEIDILAAALEHGGTYRVRRSLKRRLALREWCLLRYGGPSAESARPL